MCRSNDNARLFSEIVFRFQEMKLIKTCACLPTTEMLYEALGFDHMFLTVMTTLNGTKLFYCTPAYYDANLKTTSYVSNKGPTIYEILC